VKALTVSALLLLTPAADSEVNDDAIQDFISRQSIPAAHVTLLRGDRVILQRGYGAAVRGEVSPEPSSLFPIGSISKQFTAATIVSLADEGLLRLDAPVREYLPEWFASEPNLRVTHLLSQTSGIADFLWLDGYRALADAPTTPVEAYIELAAAAPRRFEPGARWAYSNTNYKALALIAERVTGRPFDDVLEHRILRPMGIEGVVSCHRLRSDQIILGVNAGGKPTPLDASAAAYVGDGGLCANAESLAKWLRAVLAPPSRSSVLTPPTVLADGTQVPYGYGLSTREFLGRRIVWHGGNVDSHTAVIAYLPDDDLGIVLLTARGMVWLTELLPALIGAPPPVAAATISPAPPPAGNFEDGLFSFRLTPDGESLQVEIDLIGRFRFIPAGPHEYVAEELPATFRLRWRPEASRDRFEFDWGEVRSYARRVKP
jgi:CubicO group peptidase (beta-lactamase class C family)